MYKTYVQCLICKKEFECDVNDTLLECAKHHRMKRVKIEDIGGFVCEDCYFKLLE